MVCRLREPPERPYKQCRAPHLKCKLTLRICEKFKGIWQRNEPTLAGSLQRDDVHERYELPKACWSQAGVGGGRRSVWVHLHFSGIRRSTSHWINLYKDVRRAEEPLMRNIKRTQEDYLDGWGPDINRGRRGLPSLWVEGTEGYYSMQWNGNNRISVDW